jgi:hypothetical protein
VFGSGTLVRRQERCKLIRETSIEVSRAGPCEPNFELAGIEIHLFGDHDRLHRTDALTDVGVLCDQRYLFRAYLDPGIEAHRVRSEAGRQRIAVCGRGRRFGVAIGAESDAAGYGGRSENESPAGKTL